MFSSTVVLRTVRRGYVALASDVMNGVAFSEERCVRVGDCREVTAVAVCGYINVVAPSAVCVSAGLVVTAQACYDMGVGTICQVGDGVGNCGQVATVQQYRDLSVRAAHGGKIASGQVYLALACCGQFHGVVREDRE